MSLLFFWGRMAECHYWTSSRIKIEQWHRARIQTSTSRNHVFIYSVITYPLHLQYLVLVHKIKCKHIASINRVYLISIPWLSGISCIIMQGMTSIKFCQCTIGSQEIREFTCCDFNKVLQRCVRTHNTPLEWMERVSHGTQMPWRLRQQISTKNAIKIIEYVLLEWSVIEMPSLSNF